MIDGILILYYTLIMETIEFLRKNGFYYLRRGGITYDASPHTKQECVDLVKEERKTGKAFRVIYKSV